MVTAEREFVNVCYKYIFVKAEALLTLWLIEMHGFDISWVL